MSIYISRGEETSGPYSSEKVQEYLAEGLLLPTDLAWLEGMENWVPLSELAWEAAYPETIESPGGKGSKRGLLIGAGLVAATVVIGVVVYLPLPVSDHPNDSKVDNLAKAEPPVVKEPPDSINEVTNAPPETVRTNTPTSSGGPQDPITEEPLPKGPEVLKALAEKGDAKAQNKLGEKYYYGRGVEKDYEKAINWYRKAGEQNHAEAQDKLGHMYEEGEGVEEDDERAVFWYRKAAEQGNDSGQYNLGLMYDSGEGVEEDDERAVYWYRKAAEQGNDRGQTNLGLMYRWGWGVEEDDEEAVKWFRKAAVQGQAWGQDKLGDMYDEGEGVEEDDERAVFWYRKAAAQGWKWAQYNLGMMYMKGEGVEKNIRQAYLWYSLAAEQDDEDSKKRKRETAGQLTSEDIKKVNQWTKQWSAWKLARGWPENPQASEGPFAALEKKFGFRVHYQEDDIFTGDPSPEDNPAKPIRPDELKRLPKILERALAKYPTWVVRKHLNRVRFVGDLFHEGGDMAGLSNANRKSLYVEVSNENKPRPDKEVEATLHHEFAHILHAEIKPFPEGEWKGCTPSGFEYKKGLENKSDWELWKDGYYSNYSRTDMEEDFCEFSALVFEPRKAKLLFKHYPALDKKFGVWLKVYQKIDKNFTEERLFPKGLIDPDLPHPEVVRQNELLELKEGTYLYLPTGRPYSARALEYRDKEKTQKKYEILYREGKEVSTSWYFYKDGKLEQIAKHKDGKRISGIYFHSNGQKIEEGTYKDDEADGPHVWWDKEGKLEGKSVYKNGKRISSIIFHPNGEKRREQYYKNGKVDGISTWWDKEGKLEHKDKYQDSKRISSIFFHPNGEKRREQYYKNGKVDGIVTRWHDNGQKAYGATYRDGKQIEPTVKRWNRDGSPKTLK